jgi:hypothetical protein
MKRQIPSSNEKGASSGLEIELRDFGAWNLELHWGLELGAWCFFL